MLKYKVTNAGPRKERSVPKPNRFGSHQHHHSVSNLDCIFESDGLSEPLPYYNDVFDGILCKIDDIDLSDGVDTGIEACSSSAGSAYSSGSSADEDQPGIGLHQKSRPFLNLRGRSASICSLSSTSTASSAEPSVEWGMIKVHTHALRPDSDYKTLFISNSTTAQELVNMVLGKFKCRLRDPNLAYLTMEIMTRHDGNNIKNLLTLDSCSQPLVIQQFHPRDQTRFIIQLKKGIAARIYDSCIIRESVYKSLLISEETTCGEVLSLLLQLHKLNRPVNDFIIVDVNTSNGRETYLNGEEALLPIQRQMWRDHFVCQFHVRYSAEAEVVRSNFKTISSNACRSMFLAHHNRRVAVKEKKVRSRPILEL